jgi:hypothetical protein
MVIDDLRLLGVRSRDGYPPSAYPRNFGILLSTVKSGMKQGDSFQKFRCSPGTTGMNLEWRKLSTKNSLQRFCA